jgi:hypothetical protein
VRSEKQYEILPSLPSYGPMYIPISETGEPFYSEGYAVRFYKSDGTEWVANFQPGWTDLKHVIKLEKTSKVLVLAYGTCYLMNPDDTKPIAAFGVGYSQIFKASHNRHVLQDQTDLTIIEPDGTYWHTKRISLDGLAEVNVENNIVSGLAFNPTHDTEEWVKFTYDIDTKILTGGSF